MTTLNTHLTLNLTEHGTKNIVTVLYKPTEFQAANYGDQDKSLALILALGTKSCHLYKILMRLNTLLTSQVNIYDHLIFVSHGLLSVKPELVDKKLTVSKLLNSLPHQQMNQIITFLINTFVKESEFYDFSLGMLDVVSNKIKNDLDGDFIKIKRRINDSWSVGVTVESVDSYFYHSKISSFSFKDNYGFNICDAGGVETVTKKVSQMFSSSIKPYTDIFMEKIVNDSFKSIQTHYDTSRTIHNQLEKIAWELFTEDGNKRHSDPVMYSQFDELTTMFSKNFSETSFHCPPSFVIPKRQVTAAISVSDNIHSTFCEFDYADFSTYQNTHHYNFVSLKKKGLPTPHFMTENEIIVSIARTKRYFAVYKLGEASVISVLKQKETFSTFESVVIALELAVNSLVDAVCLLYNEDSELSF